MLNYYCRQAHKSFKDGPYTVVETRVPTKSITPYMRASVDSGIDTVVIPTNKLKDPDAPQIWNKSPLPKR